MRHLWSANKEHTSPKDYIRQDFNEVIEEYYIEYADNKGMLLSYDGGDTNNAERLQDIEVLEGYWLCYHDGHTGAWQFSHYIFKEEAVARRKELYMRYFKYVEWYWIVKV